MDDYLRDMYSKKRNHKNNIENISNSTSGSGYKLINKARSSLKTNMIEIQGNQLEIPNTLYISKLEEKIEQLTRSIRTLQNRVNSLTYITNKQTSEINKLKQDSSNRYRFD